MKTETIRRGAMTVMLIAALPLGCGKKVTANSELERAAAELAKAEPSPAATPAPAPKSTASAAPAAPVPAATQAPSQQLNSAMVSFKNGNLEDAVTRLQLLRASTAISPQQRIALNDAIAAVMREIYTMAAKGDARAIAAAKQYEQFQTRVQ